MAVESAETRRPLSAANDSYGEPVTAVGFIRGSHPPTSRAWQTRRRAVDGDERQQRQGAEPGGTAPAGSPGSSTAGAMPPRADASASRLRQLIFLAQQAQVPHLVREASALAERLEEGLFYVACVGQFKRGKSTLLNALLGEAVLPVGVVPVTSVVTILRRGEERCARVRFTDGGTRNVEMAALATYVSEAENPENAKGVAAVEVFLPSPLLAHGMCLVDTPGLGSVFAGNTAVTRQFVPHIDAALVVLGADPPLSGEELELVRGLSQQVSELIFVLNKVDRLSAAECAEASRFAQTILTQRLGRPVGALLQVSAAEQLSTHVPTRDWEPLRQRLESLARQSGAHLVEAAQARGTRRLEQQLLGELTARGEALQRPLEESQQRLEALRSSVADAERSLRELGYLFQAEQDRLSRDFGREREHFLAEALPTARQRFTAALGALPHKKPRAHAVEQAQRIAQRQLEDWRPRIEPVAERMYSEACGRLTARAEEFLARLGSSGAPGMEALPRDLEPRTGFRIKSGFYYTHLMRLTGAGPLGVLLDILRSPDATRRAIEHEVGGYLERLLSTNSSRVAGALDEQVMESRRALEGELRTRLRQLVDLGARALEHARARHLLGAQAVQEELRHVEALRARVQDGSRS